MVEVLVGCCVLWLLSMYEFLRLKSVVLVGVMKGSQIKLLF